MRCTTALASWSTRAVCGAEDAYAATGTSAGSDARAIARTRPRSVTMPTNRWPSTTASAPSCAWSIRRAATARLSSISTVNSPGLQASSTLMSLSLGGAPAFLRGLAKHWSARRLLRRQRRPDGIKHRLGPNLEHGPAFAELCKGPDELGPSALGPPDGVGEEQGVVRSQQRPTPWASAGDLGAFDQLAQQQIALAVGTDGHDPHGVGCLLHCFRRPAAAVGEAARLSGSIHVALWPMIAGSLAGGRTRR